MKTTEANATIADVRGNVEQPIYDIAAVETKTSALATTNNSVNFADTVQMQLSRVKVAYAVSQNMPEDAPEGSLVISTSDGGWAKLLAANAQKPLTILIMNAKSYWKEWLTSDAFSSGARPKTYPTAEAAVADGQTVAWAGDSRPTVAEAFDINMLVKMPEGMTDGTDAFTLILDDEPWAPCIMTVDKSGAPRVKAFLSNLLLRDASKRHVPMSQAHTYSSFCTLCVKSQPSRNNPSRKFRVPTFAALLDQTHRPVAPSEEFCQDLENLISCFANPGGNPTADTDDMPF